jgi:glycosyltransferase involved in cell wall biosynthesis
VTPNLSLVVLAYNEAASVAPFLDDCLAYLGTRAGVHEVLLVDDGSTDDTAACAEAVARRDPRVRLLRHDRNRGMGAGMRTGLAAARGDYVTILAADGQVRAHELDKMIPRLGDASIVTSVYARRPHQWYRVFLSWGLRAMMRVLLGISFRLEGIYLFPARVARDEIGLDRIGADTFFFSFELITRALARGHTLATVAISSRPRLAGRSKVLGIGRMVAVAREVLAFRGRLRRERRAPARMPPDGAKRA